MVPTLVASLPADQLRPLIRDIAPRLESPDALADTAHNLYVATDDARWAYEFLKERFDQLRLADSAVLDMLWELPVAGGCAGEDPGLTEEVARRIGNLVERDRLDEALPLLRQAGQAVGGAERDRLYHGIADRLARKHLHDAGAELMVELAHVALQVGDIESASDALERSVGLWAEHAPGAAHPEWLSRAAAAVMGAWQGVAELVEWRTADHERRRAALRARFLNRRILIAGGLKRTEWVERIQDMTGAEVDWAERFRDEGDDLERFAERIRARRYDIVVHLLQKSGHEVQDRLKTAAAAAGVPWVSARSAGWRGVVEALQLAASSDSR
jgi:hypothetical protein